MQLVGTQQHDANALGGDWSARIHYAQNFSANRKVLLWQRNCSGES